MLSPSARFYTRRLKACDTVMLMDGSSDTEQVKNPGAFTPGGQGSDVSLGWKPTIARPLPAVRCTQIKKNGERCGNWGLLGYVKCRRHAGPGYMMEGGNTRKWIEANLEAARLRLVNNADMAIDVLEQLMQPGSSEGIRLRSATEVLDRVGVRGGFEVQIEADITLNPSDTLKERLTKLTKGAAAVQAMKERRDNDSDTIEGEVISDTDDQPDEQGTLF